MKQQLNIGIIGHGRIGQIHLKNTLNHPMVQKVSVCDPKDVALPPTIKAYKDYKELIDKEHPDAVLICTPTPTHFDIIEYCCKNGIHIFCEKPVDLETRKIAELHKMVDESMTIVQVGFNRRFDPDFAALKTKILNREIGDIHQVTLFSRDPGLPSMEYIASSGGMMMDMTIHDFDMCRFLTGSEVSEVYAKGQILVDRRIKLYNDIDTATIVLTMANKATCTIHNSRSAIYGYDQRIEVFGSKGMISVDNNNIHRLKMWTNEGAQTAPPQNFFLERYASSYKIELDTFLQRLNGQPVDGVHLKDAFIATQIADAANRSIRESQVIKMNDSITLQ